MRFPIRNEKHILEQKSQNYLRNNLPPDWVVNQPQHDYGQDIQIEIPEGVNLKGLELVVQLKAAKNSSGYEKTETIQLKVSTYNYLRKNLRVVMLVKYVESANKAYWLLLRDIKPPLNQNQKSFTVHIPKENMVSTTKWSQIKHLIRDITNLKLGAVNG